MIVRHLRPNPHILTKKHGEKCGPYNLSLLFTGIRDRIQRKCNISMHFNNGMTWTVPMFKIHNIFELSQANRQTFSLYSYIWPTHPLS